MNIINIIMFIILSLGITLSYYEIKRVILSIIDLFN